MTKQNTSKNIRLRPQIVGAASPNHFHTFFESSLAYVLVVNSSKEETVVSHFGKQGCLFGRVAEGVNVPGNVRSCCRSKVLLNESKTLRHLLWTEERNNMLVAGMHLISEWLSETKLQVA